MSTPPPTQAPGRKIPLFVWILGIAGCVMLVALVAGVLLVPRLDHAQMFAQEMGALRTVTTLHTAEAQYFSQYGKFAATLGQLGPPSSGQLGPAAADLIPAELAATGEGSGYQYTLALTAAGYTVNANPKVYGTTGLRTFFSDQSLTVHQHKGPEPASSSDPEIR